jgi:hypothetical protein
MNCWHITDDLDTLAHFISEHSTDIPAELQDKLLNMILGLKELYHWKHQQTFQLFEELVMNGTIKGRTYV